MFIETDYSNSMVDCLQFLDSIYIFENGKQTTLNNNDNNFKQLKRKIEEIFSNARILPAFGVSLHSETLNAIKTENWLQLNFCKELIKNELPFNSLLFKLEETSGINLIRLYNGKYDGRCIYLDLENNIDLFKVIKKAQWFVLFYYSPFFAPQLEQNVPSIFAPQWAQKLWVLVYSGAATCCGWALIGTFFALNAQIAPTSKTNKGTNQNIISVIIEFPLVAKT